MSKNAIIFAPFQQQHGHVPRMPQSFITSQKTQDIDVASIEPIQSFLSLLYILLYNRRIIYIKGLRSFVLVLWMQRQCPVQKKKEPFMRCLYMLIYFIIFNDKNGSDIDKSF